MSAVSAQIVLRFARVARSSESPEALLARVGIDPAADRARALAETVDAEAYYDLLERAAGARDHTLALRYAESMTPDDFGALGLAVKTASDVEQALQRLARYVLAITDSLEYALSEGRFALLGRPHHRRGACIANEGALAAVASLIRQITVRPVWPAWVAFQHGAPPSLAAHREFFGCPVHFGAPQDALGFDDATLAVATRLGDEGLCAYFVAELEVLRSRRLDSSLAARVGRELMDSLCDGPPSRAQVARRLGMSERTLHRRLADAGLSFREIAEGARRQVAESLLRQPEHSLAEVAFLTGFANQSAFQRAFKRWSGQTPLAFRQAPTDGA